MTDEEIKGLFYSYGQYVSGKDYALIRAIEKVIAPQRTWVGLTDEQKEALSQDAEGNPWVAVELAEAKLKEQNS